MNHTEREIIDYLKTIAEKFGYKLIKKEDEKCPYCGGTKVNVDINDEHYSEPCPQCKGAGKEKGILDDELRGCP